MSAGSKVMGPVRLVAGSSSMRLALAVSILFTLATFVAGSIAFVVMSRDMNNRLERDARQMAENLAVTYQISGLSELQAQIATNAATTRDYSNLYLFMDRTGRTVFGNFNIHRPFTGAKRVVAGKDIVLAKGAVDVQNATFLAYGLRIPAGWIITARDTRWITETKNFLMRAIIWGLGFALLLSFSMAVFLARRSEARIKRLYLVLNDVARGDLSARYKDKSNWHDDIGRVAETVNATLDRLALTVDSLRQVSNDVAHDLRTPLTRLRTRIEPLLSRKDLPEDAIVAIQKADAEVDAVVRTFNAILRIAQLEGSNATLHREPVDLSNLCATIHDMLDPVAEEMGHHFTVHCGPGGMSFMGDRGMLAQAVVNIVENAFRHCPAPAEITLAVNTAPNGIHITVCDNGPGIPEAEHENVLRRFYRLEASRNTEGSGLGLSLVAAIIRRHGGKLSLTDNAPGLCVHLELPLTPGGESLNMPT